MKLVFLSIVALVTNLAFAQGETPAASATPAAGTSTMQAGGSETVRSPYGISFFMIGGYSDQQFNNERPSFAVFDSYISFNYRLSKDFRISARPAFGYSTEGFDYRGNRVDDKARLRDFSLLATMYNLMDETLPAEMDLKFQPRLYLPTSDSSKEQGMIARLRTELEAKYATGKHSGLRFNFKPSYFFQRNTTYIRSNANLSNVKPSDVRTTTMADLEQVYEYNYDINKYFALKPALQFNDEWSNASDANDKTQFHKSEGMYGIGLEVTPSRSFNFTTILQTKHDLIDREVVAETSYVLMLNATLL